MKEKILILVKTYPTFSQTYFELVCTAGIKKQNFIQATKKRWNSIFKPLPNIL